MRYCIILGSYLSKQPNCKLFINFILASRQMMFKCKNTRLQVFFFKYHKNQAQEHPPSTRANQAFRPEKARLTNHDAIEASRAVLL